MRRYSLLTCRNRLFSLQSGTLLQSRTHTSIALQLRRMMRASLIVPHSSFPSGFPATRSSVPARASPIRVHRFRLVETRVRYKPAVFGNRTGLLPVKVSYEDHFLDSAKPAVSGCFYHFAPKAESSNLSSFGKIVAYLACHSHHHSDG